MNSLPDWLTLSNVADVLSLVGFALTIGILVQTSRLRNSLSLRARSPQIREKLEAINKNFPHTIKIRTEKPEEFNRVIASTIALLESLDSKVESRHKMDISSILLLLRQRRALTNFWRKPDLNEANLWIAFKKMQIVAALLTELEKDILYE